MRVFLSYSRDDKQRIDLLRTDLEELGHAVWMDRRLYGGVEWWTAILTQIRDADVLILALTAASVASEACLAEVRYARALSRAVVPIRLAEGVDAGLAPDPLPRLHWIPYLSGNRDELFGLVRALSAVTTAPLPDALPPDPPVPGSYLMDLSATVRSAEVLDLSGQLTVLHRIETGLTEARYWEPIASLLNEFRRRHDLLVDVLPVIERVQAQVEHAIESRSNDDVGPRQGPAGKPKYSDSPLPLGADATVDDRNPDPTFATPVPSSVDDQMKAAVLRFQEDAKRWSVDPDIPSARLQKIASSFDLLEGETVLAVYDTSMWGRGDNYFAVTDQRLLNRDTGITHAAHWTDLTPDKIKFDGRDLQIDGRRWGVGYVARKTVIAIALRDTLRAVVRAVAEF